METYLIKRKITVESNCNYKNVLLRRVSQKIRYKTKKIVTTVEQNFAGIQTIAKTMLKEIGFGHFGMNKSHRFQDEDLRKIKQR